MKDFTEITLCPEAPDGSKVGLGVWVLLMSPPVHPRVPGVPPALAVPQTEFCNPVFEGEEPRAAPSAETPPDKEGTGPAPRPDGLGTSLGFVHTPLSVGLGAGWWLWGCLGTQWHRGDKRWGLGQPGRWGDGLAAPRLCPLSSPPGRQLWRQVSWRYRADCKFTWLCVALMSAILLFLIALLLGIVIHRERRAGRWLSLGWGHRTGSEWERGAQRTPRALPAVGRERPHG